jgi:hypothetical protein
MPTKKLGAFEIVYENPNRYGEEARAILKAFAGYTQWHPIFGLVLLPQELALMASTLLLVSEARHIETETELFERSQMLRL